MAKDLNKAFKAYKSGEGEIPTVRKLGLITKAKETYKVVLTKEIYDRDEEIVMVSGFTNVGDPIVFIDAHDQSGRTVDTRLGTVLNTRVDGDTVVGEIKFVDTEAGRAVKAIADDPDHILPVSIGFGVMEYDHQKRAINQWVLYELSSVNVPANPKAQVIKSKDLESIDKLNVKLNNYEDIHPKIKKYRSFAKEVRELLEIEASGDELLDLESLHHVLLSKLKSQVEVVETQELPKTETQTARFRDYKSLVQAVIEQQR
jgi:phage head maturation protease